MPIKIWSSAYSMVFSIFLLFSGIPFFITNLNSCIILVMYILNNSGERPHPCLAKIHINIIRPSTPNLSNILFCYCFFIACTVHSVKFTSQNHLYMHWDIYTTDVQNLLLHVSTSHGCQNQGALTMLK